MAKFFTSAVAGFALLAMSLLAASGRRVRLLPKFTAGEALRYQIETRTTTAGTTTAPIANPEGASKLRQAASLIVRLDVLDVQPSTDRAMGRVRLRATYEKSTAKSESDAYDLEAQALEDQYNRLEGRSLEFTIEPDGKLSDIKGIEDVLANPSTAGAARSWMSGLSSGAGFPKDGIVVGQKWTNEQPLEGTPLAGLIWRTEATYLRDELCRQAGAVSATDAPRKASEEICAVILTRFEILHRGSRDDETPDDYRHNGLRTKGTWTGAGESIDSISLSNGLLSSSTQTSSQEMDFEITSALSGSKLRYAGRVESESAITRLPPAPAQP
ncbi:MAG: hypothetical protein WBP79_10060 [Candidatus Acidiferrales bacterium]